MKKVTIIAYPSARDNSLLSLTDTRSKYMIPFGGRFRIVDFTLRNILHSKAGHAIMYSNVQDDLASYVQHHTLLAEDQATSVRVIMQKKDDLAKCYAQLQENVNALYLLYNGDNPGIIDFAALVDAYKAKRATSVLYKITSPGSNAMAQTLLITTRKVLFKTMETAIKEERHSPNLFEMIINMLILKGITHGTHEGYYWPIKNIPDYYHSNMELFRDRSIGNAVYFGSGLKSGIRTEQPARVGVSAEISDSFVSDGCIINGRVQDSIIFPGVIIAEKTIIKQSILLPNVAIGQGSRIEKTIIDEYTDFDHTNVLFNIGKKCSIGTDEEYIKNSMFPHILYDSITLVGKNCILPETTRIGGACYIAPGTGHNAFRKTKRIQDGLSVVTEAQTADPSLIKA